MAGGLCRPVLKKGNVLAGRGRNQSPYLRQCFRLIYSGIKAHISANVSDRFILENSSLPLSPKTAAAVEAAAESSR